MKAYQVVVITHVSLTTEETSTPRSINPAAKNLFQNVLRAEDHFSTTFNANNNHAVTFPATGEDEAMEIARLYAEKIKELTIDELAQNIEPLSLEDPSINHRIDVQFQVAEGCWNAIELSEPAIFYTETLPS